MTIRWTDSISDPIYNDSLTIRKDVFINEQHISPAIEISEEEESYHFVVYSKENTPIATCRLKQLDDTTFKLQRFAVRPTYRKKAIGKSLIQEVESFVSKYRASNIVLSAQEHALPFYLKQGYVVSGRPFEEIGIPHYPLKKSLSLH